MRYGPLERKKKEWEAQQASQNKMKVQNSETKNVLEKEEPQQRNVLGETYEQYKKRKSEEEKAEQNEILVGHKTYRQFLKYQEEAEKSATENNGYVNKRKWWEKPDGDYEYINDTALSPKYLNQDGNGGFATSQEKKGYDYLTEDEIKEYNAIYNTQGKDKAKEYLKTLNLTERMADDTVSKRQEFADKHPVLGSASSVMSNIAHAGQGFIEGAIGTFKGDGIDINSYGNIQKRASNAMSETIGNKFDSSVGKFLYQVGMSMANSYGTRMAAEGLGYIGINPELATSFILGSNAATDAMINAKERGISDEKALLTGTAQGAAEAVFEKWSLGNIEMLKEVPVSSIKDVMVNVVKQAGVEGSEETFTSIANAVTDRLINADLSETKLNVQNYIDQGYSEEEAEKNAGKDFLKQLFLDFLGGAISGGVMSGGVSSLNYALNRNTAETTQDQAEQESTTNPPEEVTENTQPITEETDPEWIPWEEAIMYAGEQSENQEVAPAQISETETRTENEQTQDAKLQNVNNIIDTTLQYGEATDAVAADIVKNKNLKTVFEEKTGVKITGTEEQQKNAVKETVKSYGKIHGSTVNNTQNTPVALSGAQNATINGRGVEIIGVKSVSGSNPKFEASDGKIYNTEEIEFAENKSKKLYSDAAKLAVSAGSDVANEMLRAYKPEFNIAAYSWGFDALYRAGKSGVPMHSALKAADYAVQNTDVSIMRRAWELGAKVKTAEDSKTVIEKKQQKRKGKGTFEDETRQGGAVAEIARLVANRTGIDIERKVSIKNDANAAFVPSTMTMLLSENAQNEYTALIHELGEFGLSYNREDMKGVQEAIIRWWAEEKGIKGIDDMDILVKNYQSVYAKAEGSKTTSQAIDEMINDALGGLFSTDTGVDQFVQWLQKESGYNQTEQRTIIQRIVEMLDNVVQYLKKVIKDSTLSRAARETAQMEEQRANKIRQMFLDTLEGAIETANTTGEYTTDAAIKNSLKNFAEQYDAWDKKTPNNVFDVAIATDVYDFLGVKDRVIKFDASKIIKIRAKHDGMSDTVIKQIPEILNRPVLIMKSKKSDTRVVVTGMLLDENNKPVIAVLELEPQNRKGIIVDEIKVVSAYGKDGMQNFINKSEILYTTPDKQIISRWAKHTRLQLPVGKASADYSNILSDAQENATHEMKFSLGGIDALTADNDARIRAYQLEQDGKNDLEIFRETGWFRGADGKWRFEIDDSEAKVHRQGNVEFLKDQDYAEWSEMSEDVLMGLIDEEDSETMERYEKLSEKAKLLEESRKIRRVADYLEHPQLFDAYPFIRNIRVNQVEEKENKLGSYSMYDGINIIKRYFEECQELNLKKTLLHEIQHVIQHFERFASGANSDTWKNIKITKNQQKYDDAIKRKREVFDGGNDEFRSLIRKLNYLQLEKNFGEEYDRVENELYEKYEKRYMDYDEAMFEVRMYADSEELSSFEKYEMTAGEIEARDTENRSEWSIETRKGKIPNRTTKNGVIFTESKMNNPFVYQEEDIRFSLREDYDALEERYRNTLRENDTYKTVIDSLESRLNIQKGISVSKESIEKAADKIYRRYKSNYDKADFVDKVAGLFQSGETNKGNFLYIAEQIMRPVLENSKNNLKITDYAEGILKDIRKTPIKVDEMQRNEAAYHHGTFNDYRKSLFGRATFSDKGTSLDILWKQWSETYPEWFDENISPVDQPVKLAEIINSLKEDYSNEYGFSLDDAVSYAAMELMNEYANLPEVKSMTDKAASAQFKSQYMKLTNAIKKEYQEKYEKQIAELKREHRSKLTSQEAKFRATMSKSRGARLEAQEKKKYKDSIIKSTKTITRWFEENTDKQHIPEILRDTTLNFLKSMSFTSENGWNTQDTIQLQNRLNILYRKFSSEESDAEGSSIMQDIDPDFLPTMDGLISMLERSEEVKKIADMDSMQLKEVAYLVGNLKRTITTANKLIGNKQYERVSEIGDSSINHMAELKAKKKHGKWTGMGMELLNTHMLDSFSFFKQMGEGAKSIHHEIREGFNKRVWMLEEAKKYMKDLIGDTKIKNWTGKNATLHEFSYNGQEFSLTTGQLLNLYVLSKRPQALNHLTAGNGILSESGGFTIDTRSSVKNQKIPERRIKISEAQMKEMFEQLTPEQRKIADSMQKFLAKNCSEWGNEVSMTLYGYKKFGEKTYWPIKTNDNFNKTDDKNANGSAGDNTSLYAIRNQGMTKNLVKNANNPIVVGDIFDVFSEHVANMANYNAFVVPLSDAMKWYNYKSRTEEGAVSGSIKEEMERAFGTGAKKYFINFIKDVNGEVNKGTASEISDTFTSKYKAAAVGANIRTVVQQPTAYLRAASVMDAKYLAAGFTKKPAVKEMQEHSAIAVWKSWGYFETGLGQSMKKILTGEGTAIEKVVELSMWGTGKADDLAWGTLWNAIKAEVADKNKDIDISSEEYMKLVSERFDEVVDQTQVVDTVLHRSQIMRSQNGIVKMATAFMSEPTKSYNLLHSAIRDTIEHNTSQNRKEVAKRAAVYALTGIATAAAASMVDVFRDDDEEKEWAEKYLEHFKANAVDNLNPMGMIPYLKEFPSLWEGYDSSRMDMAGISNLVTSVQQAIKFAEGDSTKNLYGVSKSIIRALSQVTGVPMYNAMRDVESLIEQFTFAPIDEKEWTNKTVRMRLLKAVKEGNDKQLKKYLAWYDEKYKEKIAEGKSDKDARAALKSSITSQFKEIYQNSTNAEKIKIKNLLLKISVNGKQLYKDYDWSSWDEKK